MDSLYGGKDFAATSKFMFRSRQDPRFTDRRMQLLLSNLAENLDKFGNHELSQIFYSVVKLRLPDDVLINGCVNQIV